jgi:hypothetical protein
VSLTTASVLDRQGLAACACIEVVGRAHACCTGMTQCLPKLCTALPEAVACSACQSSWAACPPTCPGAEVVIEAHRLRGGHIAELWALAAHHQRHHLQACHADGSREPVETEGR